MNKQKIFWEREELTGRRKPDHPVVKAHGEAKLKAINEYIDLTMCESILDVGCGTGCFTILFEQYAPTTGIYFSEEMLSDTSASM
jgi:cyclopropane fatty-acyl-phospholipid synthase-like methyltransferase